MPTRHFGPQYTLTREAQADLSSGYQYTFVRAVAGGLTNMASEAVNSDLLGVMQNKPKAGEGATIAFLGESIVIAGAAVTEGDIVSCNGSGRAITVVSGAIAGGRALTAAGADGDQMTVQLFPPVRWAGAP